MRPNRSHVPVESDVPFRGLATTVPATKLHPAFSPRLMNVTVRDGYVQRRYGATQLGQRLIGKVLAITEFGPLGEDPVLVVLTDKRQYYYDTTQDNFVDISFGRTQYSVTGFTAGGAGVNAFKIGGGDFTGTFTAGLVFGVENSTSNNGVYNVTSSSHSGGTTTIVVDEVIPQTSSANGRLVTATDLTTTTDDWIDFVHLTDLHPTTPHRLLFTNGVDTPRYWDGDTTGTFVEWEPIYGGGFVTCKSLAVFNEHLFVGNIETGAGEDPQGIAWSNAGEFDNFDDGTAGYQLLYSMTDGIRAMKVLGDRLVVYSPHQTTLASYVGLPAVFAFEVVIPTGLRLAGPRTIESINVGHVFLSEENIYLFDGTRGLRVLGNLIYKDYKATKDHEFLIDATMINDPAKRTMFISVPDQDAGTTTYTMFYDVFDLGDIVWAKEKYHDEVSAWGFYTNRTESLTWADASYETVDNPWSNEIGSWNAETEQLEFPIRCYGTPEGRLMLANESALTDRGFEVTQLYETKDFETPQSLESVIGRWIEIEFEAEGSTVEVSYSTDRGGQFSTPESVSLTTTLTAYRVPVDVSSRCIRVRFESTDRFTLTWVRLWVRPGGAR